MFSVTLKMMRKNLRMLIPAGIAILIGSAFIAATFLFGNALNASLGKNATAGYGGANYVVGAKSPDSNNSSTTLKDLNLDQVRAVTGVKGVRADLMSQAAVSTPGQNSVTTVLPMASSANLMPLHLSQGSWPRSNGQIALTQETAKRLNASIGDMVTVALPVGHGDGDSPTTKARVVGLTTDPNGAYSYSAGASAQSEADYFMVQGLAGHMEKASVSSVYLSIDTDRSASDINETISTLKNVLPSNFTVMSRQKAADQAIEQIGNGQNVFTTFLLVFGVIALLVAAIVIANTFQVLVAQRRRTLALLRTIGAKKGQLYRSVVLEAFLLGTVASALGIAFAAALMQVLSALHVKGLTGGDFAVVFDWRVVVIPLIFGIVMTVLASLGSARMATSVTPLEALRPIEQGEHKKSSIARAIFSAVLILIGGALATLAVMGVRAAGDQPSEAGFGMTLAMAVGGGAIMLIGIVISAIWWMPWLMRGAGAVVSASGPSAKVAVSNVAKNPRRVAATGVALFIGVTLVTIISTGAASAKQTAEGALSQRYAVDVSMSGGNLDNKALEKVSKVSGVDHASLLRSAQGKTDTTSGDSALSVGLVGISAQQRTDLMRVNVANAPGNAPSGDAPGTVVMNETLRNGSKNPYKSGDPVKVTVQKSDGTRQSLSLVTKLADFVPMTDTEITALVDPSVLEPSTGIATSGVIWMKVGNAPSAVQFMSDVQDSVSKYEGVSVSGPFAEREMWENSVNVVMAVLIGLLAVSVVIALIGVANTLSLSVIERTRESATLRAIGMTRGQLRASLGVEALIIAVVAGLSGLILGIGFGWLGSEVVLSTIGAVSFQIDWGMCAAVMGIAIVAALISSIAPARRAVKTSPVVALAEA